jgi:hypothetical protein
MRRLLWILTFAVVAWSAGAADALAEGAGSWPAYPLKDG